MEQMHFLVIQHLAIEPAGVIGDVLRAHGHRLTTIHCESGEAVPQAPDAFDGLIVMGGPQSASDTHLPYIATELALLSEAIRRDLPVIGICLGAQLLAKAAGGKIGPALQRELGWYPVYATEAAGDDPLFTGLPADGMTVFQWHGESFTLPEGGTLLATHPVVAQQAFRLGSCQYGLQFHAEVDEATIEQWIAAGASERAHLGEAGLAAIRSELARHMQPMQAWCRRMTERWLTGALERRKKR